MRNTTSMTHTTLLRKNPKKLQPKQFGRDHWSLLAYYWNWEMMENITHHSEKVPYFSPHLLHAKPDVLNEEEKY